MDKRRKPPNGVQAVTITQVILIEEAVGDGSDGNPIRPVYSYWTMLGELICRQDPCPTSSAGQTQPGETGG